MMAIYNLVCVYRLGFDGFGDCEDHICTVLKCNECMKIMVMHLPFLKYLTRE